MKARLTVALYAVALVMALAVAALDTVTVQR